MLTKTFPPATVTPAPASEEASPSSRYVQASLKGGRMVLSPDTPVSPALPLDAGHSRPTSGGLGLACPITRAAATQGRNRVMAELSSREGLCWEGRSGLAGG